jgi:hypothetical protein
VKHDAHDCRRLAKMFWDKKTHGRFEDPTTHLLVMRYRDYDMALNDKVAEPYKSEMRPDVICCRCREVVVMSNGLYQAWTQGGRKNPVICSQCALKEHATHGEDEVPS